MSEFKEGKMRNAKKRETPRCPPPPPIKAKDCLCDCEKNYGKSCKYPEKYMGEGYN